MILNDGLVSDQPFPDAQAPVVLPKIVYSTRMP